MCKFLSAGWTVLQQRVQIDACCLHNLKQVTIPITGQGPALWLTLVSWQGNRETPLHVSVQDNTCHMILQCTEIQWNYQQNHPFYNKLNTRLSAQLPNALYSKHIIFYLSFGKKLTSQSALLLCSKTHASASLGVGPIRNDVSTPLPPSLAVLACVKTSLTTRRPGI